MATLIGVVSQVIGEVYAVAGDGTRRPLVEGDRVFAGEQIVTGASGAIAIALSNGQQLTMGRDSSMALNEQMLAYRPDSTPPADAVPAAPTDSDLTDVERLQAAIEAGLDPTLEGEATAAGPGAGGAPGGAGGGHSFVLLGETGGALDPVIGFPTEGLQSGPEFPDPDPAGIAQDTPAPELPNFLPEIEVIYFDGPPSGEGQQPGVLAGPGVVDEAALANGTNPDSDGEFTYGTLLINSPDGISSIEVQGADGVWVNVQGGGTVVGVYGTLVFDAAGNWVYTLSGNTLDHSNLNATGAADQVGESFAVRVFDGDGDVSPTVALNITVYDDGPIAGLASNAPKLGSAMVDESLPAPDGQNDGVPQAVLSAEIVEKQFNSVYGADGEGSTVYSLVLNTGDADSIGSGLFAVDPQKTDGKGAEIQLSQSGNVISGMVGDTTYFTLTISPLNGEVTLDLLSNIWHGDSTDPDDAEVLQLGEGVLTLVQTLTDADGDSDSASIDLGTAGVFRFEDDAPVAGLADDAPLLGSVTVDESLPAPDGQNDGVPQAVLSAEIVEKQFNSVYGADGEGSTVYSLVLNTGDADSIGSGLFAVDPQATDGKGAEIQLSQSGNVISGMVGDTTYFTLTIDPNSGAVTLNLLSNIWHGDSTDPDDAEVLQLGEGVLTLVQTLTDADGDSDSASIDLGTAGVFRFEDDAPLVNLGRGIGTSLTVTLEGGDAGFFNTYGYYIKGENGEPVSGEIIWSNVQAQNIGDTVTIEGLNPASIGFFIIPNGALANFGVDGYTNGATLTFSLEDGQWVASLGGVQLSGAGGATVIFDNPLLNPDGKSHVEDNTDPGKQNWEDVNNGGDNDYNDVIIQVTWSGLLVHEDKLDNPFAGNEEAGQVLVASGGPGVLHALVKFGADGPGSFGLRSDTSSLEAQEHTSGGAPLSYTVTQQLDEDGNLISTTLYATSDGSVGGYPVFTLVVGADGSYLFTLQGPLDHPRQDGDDSEVMPGLGIDFSGVLNATDGDGDSVVGGFPPGSFSINVEDDVPTFAGGDCEPQTPPAEAPIQFGISHVLFLINTGNGTQAVKIEYGDSDIKDASHPQGYVDWLEQTYGGTVESYYIKAGAAPAGGGFFDSTGNLINDTLGELGLTPYVVGGNAFGGSSVTVIQSAAAEYQQTDSADCEYVRINHLVHEDVLGTGNAEGLGQTLIAQGAANALHVLVNFGADGPGTFGLLPDTSSLQLQGHTSGGLEVEYKVEGNVLTAYVVSKAAVGIVGEPGYEPAEGYDVFTLEVGADGSYLFTLHGPLDHPLDDGDDSQVLAGAGIDFSQMLVVTDGDGDPLSGFPVGSFTVNVQDDVPVALDKGNLASVPEYSSGVVIGTVASLLAGGGYGADGAAAVAAITFSAGDQGGVVTVDGDGNLIYSNGTANAQPGNPIVENFTYTLTDADGDSATANFSVTLTDVGVPEGGQAFNVVDEDGLPNGIPGGPNDVDGEDVLVTGNLGYSFGPDGVGSFSWSTDGLPSVSSGGTPVTYSVIDDGLTLIATAGGEPVFTLKVTDLDTGDYEFELHRPLDHARPLSGSDESNIYFAFGYGIEDGDGSPAAGSLSIQVNDDSPAQPSDISKSVVEQAPPSTNLMIILDVSGSMDNNPGVAGYSTRLAIAKAAIEQLISGYDDLGDVMVRLVAFNSSATSNLSGSGNVWLTAAQAISVINGLSDTFGSGTTNFDAALLTAQSAFASSGKIDGAQNVSYFLSDGVPNVSTIWPGVPGSGSSGINGAEQAAWESFVVANQIKSYALGMGTGATQSTLEPVAYNGATDEELGAIVVTNLAQLADTLAGTVSVPATGNILTEGVLDGFGADGAASLPIVAITHNSVVYTATSAEFNGLTNTLTIDTQAGGTLSVNFSTGAYTYSLNQDVADDLTEAFGYTIEDADGDQAIATLYLTTTDSSEVVAYDNFNQAMVSEVEVPGAQTSTVLANFNSTANPASSGPNYNPWIFDTTDNLSPAGDERTVSTLSDVLAAANDKWGATALAGSSSANGVRVQSNALQLLDSNSSAGVSTKVASPTFEVAGGFTGHVSFQIKDINNFNPTGSGDLFTWVLYRENGSSWDAVHNGTHASGSGATINTGVFGSGTYRLYFEANDRTSTGGNYRVRIDNITLVTIAAASLVTQATDVSGNLLTDPNNYMASSDPWAAVDDKGSEGAVLSIWDGSDYVDVGTGTLISGSWGNLSINSDGSYTYTPDADLGNVGQEDVFSYKLTQPDGDSDTASLVIKVGGSPYVAPNVVTGAGDLVGTAGDDVLIAGDGGHTLNGGAGNDRLEGGAGDDTLIGGLGDDILIGGAGNDTFVWQAGDTGHDVVKDFGRVAGNMDVLDLSELLDFNGVASSGSLLDSYLNMTFAGGNTLIEVSSTGNLATQGVDQKITLESVDLSGGTLTAAQVIDDMLSSGTLAA